MVGVDVIDRAVGDEGNRLVVEVNVFPLRIAICIRHADELTGFVTVIVVTLVIVEVMWFGISILLPEMHIAYATLIHLFFSLCVGVPAVYVSVTISKK